MNAILSLLAALLIFGSINLYKQNKRLSEGLEMAQNNIEAYQDALAGSQQASNVIMTDMKDLEQQNDILIHKLDSVRKEKKIKASNLNVAATQTQEISVNGGKGVEGDIITILKDTTYTDSLKYNDLTKIYYTIGKDSVHMRLDFKNTQYLYVYSQREYKNKKSFIKRLFTLDFKKVTRYKYNIVNTNDLIKEDSVRVIQQK